MPSQTDAEYYAAAEYHDPHSVLNNLIHAACHRKQMQNTMLQLNTMVPTLSLITLFIVHVIASRCRKICVG